MTTTTEILANAGLATSTTGAIKTTGNDTIDQSGFLRLMTAQMQYQDPFQPMDNTQMVQQMAQFSQLASANDTNKLLASISDAVSGSRLSDAASWIGKSMLVKSNLAAPDRYGQYAGELTLADDASSVSVDLVDSSGSVVKTLDLGSQKAGAVPFYWNGLNEAGETVASSTLQVKVNGVTPSQVATWASIAAIQSPASGANASLITPLGSYSASDALRLG